MLKAIKETALEFWKGLDKPFIKGTNWTHKKVIVTVLLFFVFAALVARCSPSYSKEVVLQATSEDGSSVIRLLREKCTDIHVIAVLEQHKQPAGEFYAGLAYHEKKTWNVCWRERTEPTVQIHPQFGPIMFLPGFEWYFADGGWGRYPREDFKPVDANTGIIPEKDTI